MNRCRDCDGGPCEPCYFNAAHGPHSHHNPYAKPRPVNPHGMGVYLTCGGCGAKTVPADAVYDSRLRAVCDRCRWVYPKCGHMENK